MKKIFLTLCLIIGTISASFAQLERDIMRGSTLLRLEGFTYVYSINYQGNDYFFYVDIKSSGSDGSVKFDYRMENANNTSGSVEISAKAMQEATAQFNYFAGGEVKLDDKTTVWISKKVFKDLVNNGKATISPDGGRTTTELIAKEVGYNFAAYNAISKQNMDDIAYFYATDAEGKYQYWIHFSEGNPMILKMDIGFTVQFVEMRRWAND